uniref:Odorant receptor n=1 Tax=Locusta migratoria TaxID=7004 RepID=A0A0M4JB43_LOCMI|nr:odorant receptor 61 [Locusta migratoria]
MQSKDPVSKSVSFRPPDGGSQNKDGDSAQPTESQDSFLTWKGSSESVLKYNVRCLCILGVWSLTRSRLYYLLSGTAFLLGVMHIVVAIFGSYLYRDNMEEMTLIVANMFVVCAGVTKLVIFVVYRNNYRQLVTVTDGLTDRQRSYCQGDPALKSILEDSERLAVRLTLFVPAYIATLSVVWVPMPLIAYNERRLPFVQLPFVNEVSASTYALLYVMQTVPSLLFFNVGFAVDAFFASVMIHAATQLRILFHRIKDLRLDGRGTLKLLSGDRHDIMYGELCTCIQLHQQLVRYLSFIGKVMDPIAMTQVVFSVLIACTTLFQANYSADTNTAFRCLAFLPTPGTQVFLYCWGAHNLMEQSAAVSEAAYSCSWVEASRRFKRALCLLMCRAQRPLVLTAGGLLQINRPTFISLLKASYSYYTLLGRVNNR